ncbi:deoxyribodipyrimidine photo-lyase-like isoform X2 [Littorina saxatilis]|uniref:Deoxyribodipyrimidine photo-lyase n=2 Tax=Littorina saxatilis TaxID=31220 RepID=A0AAN9APY3_9CAEN
MPDNSKKSAKELKRKPESSSSSKDEDSGTSPSKKSKTDSSGDGDLDFMQKIDKRRTDICTSVEKFKFNKKRVRVLSKAEDFAEDSEGVVYWMSRDQRVQDNWAFLYAQRLALKLELPLHVCFCLVPKFLEATIRQFGFMLKGLAEVEKECRNLGISFHLLMGEAKTVLPQFVKEKKIGGVVTDFAPLRTPMKWVDEMKEKLPEGVPFCQVDAHNIVPCWEASPKQEYSARTIRTKIHKVLKDYLTEFPPVCKHPHKANKVPEPVDWEAAHQFLQVDRSVKEVEWAKPGTFAALKMLESFCTQRLKYFSSQRNNPNKLALSNLSPWIHFGQLSVQRCIVTVKLYRSRSSEGVDAFIEEAVVRRELADNFCFYNNDHYDSIKGAYQWAQDSLEAHKGDKRSHLYTRQQLEEAKTHDDLWNAAQVQMVREGKMHGFLRMYWAKKILEWTASPEEALKEAIFLNDKYNLDGRDPNGYVGCMWSICGIHDQGWKERDVFGKIRYMNYDGCKRKFDVADFVRKYRKK